MCFLQGLWLICQSSSLPSGAPAERTGLVRRTAPFLPVGLLDPCLPPCPAVRLPGLLTAPLPCCEVSCGCSSCSKRFSLLIQKYINTVTFFSPLAWRCKTPHRVAFVEKLTKLVLSQLPNFWKLWISYVNGSLFSEVCVQI